MWSRQQAAQKEVQKYDVAVLLPWAHALAVLSLVALLFLGAAWERYWAPLREGGSWLVLKVVPLLFPLWFMLVRVRPRVFQWAVLWVWAYIVEGMVRAWSDHGLSARLALCEVLLGLMLFVSATAYLRLRRHVISAATSQDESTTPA